MKVKCAHCDSIVSNKFNGVCPNCGAALPAIQYTKSKEVQYNPTDKYVDNPLFDQELWLGFYGILYDIGQKLGILMSTNPQQEPAGFRDRAVVYTLIVDALENEAKSQSAKLLHTDMNIPFMQECESLPGWTSIKKWYNDAYHWTFDIDPVTAGFISVSEGCSVRNRIGIEWRALSYHIYSRLMCVQECDILMHSSMENVLEEQYVHDFEDTNLAIYMRDKARSIFAARRVIHWNDTPKNLYDLLRSPNVAKKLARELNFGIVSGYELDEMKKHVAAIGNNKVSVVPTLIESINRYTVEKLNSIFGIPSFDLAGVRSDLRDSLGMDELIIEK